MRAWELGHLRLMHDGDVLHTFHHAGDGTFKSYCYGAKLRFTIFGKFAQALHACHELRCHYPINAIPYQAFVENRGTCT